LGINICRKILLFLFDKFRKAKNKIATVNYFGQGKNIEGRTGILQGVWSPNGFSQFLIIEQHAPIRIDRIITLNGRPSPSYDEYDINATPCLTCMGGWIKNLPTRKETGDFIT